MVTLWLELILGTSLVWWCNVWESACNAGDLGSIPGSGKSPGEGNGNPLQYSWASLVAQMVKNLPAMWETRVWSLGWEDPLKEGMTTHFSILAWRIPTDRGIWWATVHGVRKIRTWLNDSAQRVLALIPPVMTEDQMRTSRLLVLKVNLRSLDTISPQILFSLLLFVS